MAGILVKAAEVLEGGVESHEIFELIYGSLMVIIAAVIFTTFYNLAMKDM